ncbi:sugar phosphate isomerase/epimerase [Glutamicibacter sp. MNS18]|uniref:sugar phosphate isomerase/epimerase family protein n=1 Tax=Glutamicibacter sp. MNS18 TaxID=2989817 RepID=UPI002235A1EC|nr:sugar phosphate isomerase/epimerase [Glutamicibacter sp. MNS18]MCW4464733.1 sugar phosphate isomerase/epimerase [Glutamicibacter sp. MNS18]
MTVSSPAIGLAQLSLVNTAAPQLIRIAAQAGFDFIGARVRPVTATERAYDLQPGSPLLKQTLQAVAETGVGVRDIEFLLIDGSDQRDAWLRMMEAGQALGASTLTVAASLADENQLADILSVMTRDGKAYGITPTLEVISYQAVNSLPQAAELARRTGCAIVGDTLHLSRVGTDTGQLSEHAGLIPLLQLCDGPVIAPVDREGLVAESRSERMVPGQGGFALARMVAALPEGLALSVEAPSDSTVARIGDVAWARELMAGARAVLAESRALRQSTAAAAEH